MSPGDRARLFVALPVADHVRVLAQAVTAPVRETAPELTWTRPEGWHLTLAFLGAVPTDQVPAVEEAVGRAVITAHQAPIGCRLDGAGRFRDRILWLAVDDEPSGSIRHLGEHIQIAIEDAGLPVQRRPVRPHLTLARASRRGAAVIPELVDAVPPVAAAWEAGEVALVRSVLGRGPARYEVVCSWPLLGDS